MGIYLPTGKRIFTYLVYAESEGEIYKSFMQKWAQHREMVAKMTDSPRERFVRLAGRGEDDAVDVCQQGRKVRQTVEGNQ